MQPNLPLQSSEMSSTEQLTDAVKSPSSTIPEFSDSGTRRYEDKVSVDMEMRNRNTSENYQHPFGTDNIIHPFPVPFLKRPSKLSKAYIAVPGITTATNPTSANNRTSSEQTLPPSILVANNVQESDHTTSPQKIDRDHIGKNSMENIKEAQESGEQIFFDLDNTER